MKHDPSLTPPLCTADIATRTTARLLSALLRGPHQRRPRSRCSESILAQFHEGCRCPAGFRLIVICQRRELLEEALGERAGRKAVFGWLRRGPRETNRTGAAPHRGSGRLTLAGTAIQTAVLSALA